MSSKRNRVGNFEKLPSGNIRARYRGERQTFPTMAEATAWVSQLSADRSRGTYVSPTKGRTKFSVVAGEWKKGIANVRGETERGYIRVCDNRILKELGDKPVAEIDRLTCKQYFAKLLKTNKPGTVRNVRSVLSLIMQAAVDGGFIAKNPCEHIKIKGSKPEEMMFLTREEVELVANAIAPNFRLAVLVGAYCGLRAQEIWGLKVKHFNEVSGHLTVKSTSDNEDDADDTEDDMPKSGRYRSVPVPARVVALIKETIKNDNLSMDDFLLRSERGKRVLHNNFYRRHWQPTVAKVLTRSPRFHDLRHTCVSFYLASNQTLDVTRKIVGHSTNSMTEKYAHHFPWAFEGAIEVIDGICDGTTSVASYGHVVPLSATSGGNEEGEVVLDQGLLITLEA